MKTSEGVLRSCYNAQIAVEPVFGNLKFNLGFVRFILRTPAKVRGEFLLMCIARNLKKSAKYGSLSGPMPTAVHKVLYATISWLLRTYWRLQDELRRYLGRSHDPNRILRRYIPV